MGRRIIGYTGWLLAAGCLYFFENGTATRIVLIGTVLLPFFFHFSRFRLPFFRRPETAPARRTPRIRTFTRREEDVAGDIREYAPGDPVNRIHWKLSAKREKLLIRPREERPAPAESEGTAARPAEGGSNRGIRRRNVLLAAAAGTVLPLLLCLLIPPVRRSAQALVNRLFDASEAVNRYAYTRFAVSPEETVLPAAVLLIIAGCALALLCAAARTRAPALAAMIAFAAAQAYFGLPAPGWINVLLFTLFAMRMAGTAENMKKTLTIPAAVLLITLAAALIRPGTDAGIEAASEQARDWLSRQVSQTAGTDIRETAGGETETRHVHTQSLITGEGEGAPERAFRLVTEEEEQISAPHRTDYLKIAGLLLLTIAAVVAPFLPFAWLNSRRKKAREAMAVFRSERIGDAIVAAFRHAAAWLEAAGLAPGNIPYRDWSGELKEMPKAYAAEFGRCAALFEEAAYSTHPMTEAQRERVLRLLEETERIIREKADRRLRFRLKYREWLWI